MKRTQNTQQMLVELVETVTGKRMQAVIFLSLFSFRNYRRRKEAFCQYNQINNGVFVWVILLIDKTAI